MIEQQTIKKSLNNIYSLILSYQMALKQLKYEEIEEETKFENLKHFHKEYERKHLDFEISIYKNITNKLFPFTQIFDLKNETPYMLDSKETEIFRQYIGLYTDGEMETPKELSKTFSCSEDKIKTCIGNIIESFMNLEVQEQILKERNKIIKENITNKNLKEKILNRDIEFLTMTDNLLEILKMNKIYTINDLIEMDFNKLYKINLENGYNAKLITFPRRIIDEIHDLGLHFNKLEKNFKIMYEADKQLPQGFLEKVNIKTHTKKVETILDLINAQQFEPEIISALDLNERITVDTNINSGYKKNKYLDMIEEIHANILIQIIPKISNKEITSEQIIRKEFPEMMDEEVEFVLGDCVDLFGINTPTFEPKYKLRKTYYMDKN